VEEFLDTEGASDEDVQTAIMVALLHDTVEDTHVTIDDIHNNFGDEVAKGVYYLTDPPVFVGNRKTRKALTAARLTDAPRWVRIIKRFDIMHNEQSLRIHDPKFHRLFMVETTELLFHMSMGAFKTLEEHNVG
jgi:(p)ppGpp synthase/HD superfamily hydrolase